MPHAQLDRGPNPFVINIEKATVENNTFRRVLWTGHYLQLTLMSLRPGEDIGVEIHPKTDQFLRIEEGFGVVQMGRSRNELSFTQRIGPGAGIFVPAGTWHNVINTGHSPLKLYSIYAPPQHPPGAVERTKPQ